MAAVMLGCGQEWVLSASLFTLGLGCLLARQS